MAKAIKKLNFPTDTGTPVKVQDLADLNDTIQLLSYPEVNSPQETHITSGFRINGVNIGEGVIVYMGQPYYFSGGTINQYLYVISQPTDQRTAEDGTTFYMYTSYIAQSSASATETSLGTLVGQLTSNIIGTWATPYIQTITGDVISDESIDASSKLIDGSISSAKYGDNSIPTSKLQNRSVTGAKIGLSTVTNDNIAGGTITEDKLAFNIGSQTLPPTIGVSLIVGAMPTATGDFGINRNNSQRIYVNGSPYDQYLFISSTANCGTFNTTTIIVTYTFNKPSALSMYNIDASSIQISQSNQFIKADYAITPTGDPTNTFTVNTSSYDSTSINGQGFFLSFNLIRTS